MNGVRDFLQTKAGKIASVVLLVIALGIVAISVKANFGGVDASGRMFIDATTGKPFKHSISIGEKTPVEAPSGGNTGYPAEPCYWNKDGTAKKDPTWVLLNQYVGKSGPTFCPDCGRLVVQNNPAPGIEVKPPPTRSEYESHPHSDTGGRP